MPGRHGSIPYGLPRLVSLLTDVSAEMVTAVLPLYVVVQLGLSPLAFGLLDGIYGGVTALVRLAGGHLADRGRRHKLIAGLGYGLSAAAKPALLLAATVPGIAAVLAVDRTGKGLRTAPRDALISLSSPPDQQGRAARAGRSPCGGRWGCCAYVRCGGSASARPCWGWSPSATRSSSCW